ncbi:DUF397 domain-containing protein [Streptosporangium sp. NPDC023615]|uniref:DUF397 domain-containing protein n=1 Tax=Streptosporangium sp. NPDC023615 TaxID=3154794 RepID=UPI003425B29D
MDTSRVSWRKSSRSGDGPNCVEIGVWRKSSLSGNGQNCTEIALAHNPQVEFSTAVDLLVLMRDSKDPDGPVLTFTSAEWGAFIDSIKSDGFDILDERHET